MQYLSVIGPAALPPELLDRVSPAAIALLLITTADVALRTINTRVS